LNISNCKRRVQPYLLPTHKGRKARRQGVRGEKSRWRGNGRAKQRQHRQVKKPQGRRKSKEEEGTTTTTHTQHTRHAPPANTRLAHHVHSSDAFTNAHNRFRLDAIRDGGVDVTERGALLAALLLAAVPGSVGHKFLKRVQHILLQLVQQVRAARFAFIGLLDPAKREQHNTTQHNTTQHTHTHASTHTHAHTRAHTHARTHASTHTGM